MKQLSSSWYNMVVVLTLIAIVAGAALGFVYTITKAPIEKALRDKQIKAINKVLPKHDNVPLDEKYTVTLHPGQKDSVTLVLYPASLGGRRVGVAVESVTKQGFSGEIRVMVGLGVDGKISDYQVISHKETPGLGSKMGEWFKGEIASRSVIGRNPGTEKLAVTRDGGSVDGITAATITSRAFLAAIRNAHLAFSDQLKTEIPDSSIISVAPVLEEQIKDEMMKSSVKKVHVSTKRNDKKPVDGVTDATTSATCVTTDEKDSTHNKQEVTPQ